MLQREICLKRVQGVNYTTAQKQAVYFDYQLKNET